MAWRDELRAGSFRGIPFETLGNELSGGRRGPTHEYPNRDEPFFEDMGRRSRKFSITAFVIGDDYRSKRDRLIAAFEESGAGTLVHPFYGELKVNCTDFSVSETFRQGRAAEFSIEFVEAGENIFPRVGSDTATAVSIGADTLIETARESFVRDFSVSGLAGFVSDSVVTAITGFTDEISAVVSDGAVSNGISDLIGYLPTTMGKPSVILTNLDSITNNALAVAAASTGSTNVLDFAASLSSYRFDFSSFPTNTGTRQKQIETLGVVNAMIGRVAFANEAKVIATHPFDSYADAISKATDYVDRMDIFLESYDGL
ncbi:MAG: hypothetical protein COA62_15660 [Rhodobiaceae bacterium]|nr:MAG: hypothetical protein COA62_15660 [Rhodobiaceae bacterium]